MLLKVLGGLGSVGEARSIYVIMYERHPPSPKYWLQRRLIRKEPGRPDTQIS